MKTNEEAFIEMLRENLPEVYMVYDVMNRGNIHPLELAEIVMKLSIIRSSDDGMGKIIIETHRKPDGNFMRIRTIQDKVFEPIPEERLI